MCAFEINNNDKSKYPSKENIFKLFFNKQIKCYIKTEFCVQCKRFNTYIFFKPIIYFYSVNVIAYGGLG